MLFKLPIVRVREAACPSYQVVKLTCAVASAMEPEKNDAVYRKESFQETEAFKQSCHLLVMTRERAFSKSYTKSYRKKESPSRSKLEHCVLSARWDYKQHRFKDFFFRQHRFRNAMLGGISNTRSKERSEAL